MKSSGAVSAPHTHGRGCATADPLPHRIGRASTILGPLVLAADLILFLRGKVVCDVERFADLLWRLSLDHVGDRLASNVK